MHECVFTLTCHIITEIILFYEDCYVFIPESNYLFEKLFTKHMSLKS